MKYLCILYKKGKGVIPEKSSELNNQLDSVGVYMGSWEFSCLVMH